MDSVNLDIPCFVDLALPVHIEPILDEDRTVIVKPNSRFDLHATPYSFRYSDDRYVDRS